MSYEPQGATMTTEPIPAGTGATNQPAQPVKAFAGWSMKELLRQKVDIEKAINELKASEKAKIIASMAENGLVIEDIAPIKPAGITTAKPLVFGVSVIDSASGIGTPLDRPQPASPAEVRAFLDQPSQSKSQTKRIASKIAAPKPGLKGSKLPIKYRNPKNPAETWTGRGMKPKWLVAAMKKMKAKTPESFAV